MRESNCFRIAFRNHTFVLRLAVLLTVFSILLLYYLCGDKIFFSGQSDDVHFDDQFDANVSENYWIYDEMLGISELTVLRDLKHDLFPRLCSTSLSCLFEPRHIPPSNHQAESSRRSLRILQKSTILVVAFNAALNFRVIPLLNLLYGGIFAEIRYCGPTRRHFLATEIQNSLKPFIADSDKLSNLTTYFANRYINYRIRPKRELLSRVGEASYFCVNKAVESSQLDGSSISGVFFLQDDALLSYWKFIFDPLNFDLSSSYSLPFYGEMYDILTLKRCDQTGETVNESWKKFNAECASKSTRKFYWTKVYQDSTKAFFAEIDQAPVGKPHFNCTGKIALRAGGVNRAFGGWSDMFYVAKRDLRLVMEMFQLAARNRVFQEIAVPTTFACLDKARTIDRTTSFSTGLPKGMGPWDLFDASRPLFHPFKLSSLVPLQSQSDGLTGRSTSKIMNETCLFCMLTNYSSEIDSSGNIIY